MRYLALDVGDRRIGVAVSDESGLIARPLCIIRRASKVQDFARVADLLRQQAATGLVVGLPLDDDGSLGLQATRIHRYAEALQQALAAEGLEVELHFWDETLSSQRAQELMISAGRSAARRKASEDAVAAAVILQDYLEASRGDQPPATREEST